MQARGLSYLMLSFRFRFSEQLLVI